MRKYSTIIASDLSDLSCKLNKLKQKDIKIEFIERQQSHHPLDILYSYESTKEPNLHHLDNKQKLPISGA